MIDFEKEDVDFNTLVETVDTLCQYVGQLLRKVQKIEGIVDRQKEVILDLLEGILTEGENE